MAAKITSRDFKRPRSGALSFSISRWRDFGAGLAVGLCLSLLVLVWQNYREKNEATARAETPKPEPRASASAAEPEEGAKSYDFYEMLPSFEVVVPDKGNEQPRGREASTARIERPGVYVLQAGSYRAESDADRVKSQLRLLGIDANVQRVAVDEDVRHRVRIGPIADLAETNRIYEKLRAADMDPLVIRVGE